MSEQPWEVEPAREYALRQLSHLRRDEQAVAERELREKAELENADLHSIRDRLWREAEDLEALSARYREALERYDDWSASSVTDSFSMQSRANAISIARGVFIEEVRALAVPEGEHDA